MLQTAYSSSFLARKRALFAELRTRPDPFNKMGTKSRK